MAFSVFVPLSLARTLQKNNQKSAQSLKYLIDVVNWAHGLWWNKSDFKIHLNKNSLICIKIGKRIWRIRLSMHEKSKWIWFNYEVYGFASDSDYVSRCYTYICTRQLQQPTSIPFTATHCCIFEIIDICVHCAQTRIKTQITHAHFDRTWLPPTYKLHKCSFAKLQTNTHTCRSVCSVHKRRALSICRAFFS